MYPYPDKTKQIHAEKENHYCNHFPREIVYKCQVTRSLAFKITLKCIYHVAMIFLRSVTLREKERKYSIVFIYTVRFASRSTELLLNMVL